MVDEFWKGGNICGVATYGLDEVFIRKAKECLFSGEIMRMLQEMVGINIISERLRRRA